VTRTATLQDSSHMVLQNPAATIDSKVSISFNQDGAISCIINNENLIQDNIIGNFNANTLFIGRNVTGLTINGHIKKISYYPQRLTNEQLQQLTK
jgi:hypothetical protein